MQHPRRNLFRILLAALLAFALVACDDATRNPAPIPDPPTDEKPEDEAPATGRIDLSRAIALGLGRAPTSSSNLTTQSTNPVVIALDDDGQVEELEAEETTFSDFAIINGRVFLTPSNTWALGCALVEVIDDSELECVDEHVTAFYEIQAAPDGTLYYRGSAYTESYESIQVLRKRTPEGETSEVFDLTGPLEVHSWVVASDGVLYLQGQTYLGDITSEPWVRRLNDDGSLTTLPYDGSRYDYPTLLGVWPDDNVYLYAGYGDALWQISPETDTLADAPYRAGKETYPDAQHHIEDLGGYLDLYSLRYQPPRIVGERVMHSFRQSLDLVVVELYPSPQRFDSGLAQVNAFTALGDNYYFAGRVAPDQYAIVELDTLTGDTETIYETTLEVFSITVNADATKAFLSAFDASKNRYVMAAVDLTTGETTTEPVTTTLERLEPLY